LEHEGKTFKSTIISPSSRRVRATAYNPRANGGRTWLLTFRSTQSAVSWKTFEEVVRLMDKEKDFLIFLTVVSLTSAVGLTTVSYSEMSAHVRQKCEKKFRNYMGLCHKEKIRHFTFVLGVSSKIGKKICQVAVDYDVDGIVLGSTRGSARKSKGYLSGLSKFHLTNNYSTIDYCRQHAPCEVIEVVEDASALASSPPEQQQFLADWDDHQERGRGTEVETNGIKLEEKGDDIDYHWEVSLREITHIR